MFLSIIASYCIILVYPPFGKPLSWLKTKLRQTLVEWTSYTLMKIREILEVTEPEDGRFCVSEVGCSSYVKTALV
jgi:hypothetical protein